MSQLEAQEVCGCLSWLVIFCFSTKKSQVDFYIETYGWILSQDSSLIYTNWRSGCEHLLSLYHVLTVMLPAFWVKCFEIKRRTVSYRNPVLVFIISSLYSPQSLPYLASFSLIPSDLILFFFSVVSYSPVIFVSFPHTNVGLSMARLPLLNIEWAHAASAKSSAVACVCLVCNWVY